MRSQLLQRLNDAEGARDEKTLGGVGAIGTGNLVCLTADGFETNVVYGTIMELQDERGDTIKDRDQARTTRLVVEMVPLAGIADILSHGSH